MSTCDRLACPQAYDISTFASNTAAKLSPPKEIFNTQLLLSSTLINFLFTSYALNVQTSESIYIPTAAPP